MESRKDNEPVGYSYKADVYCDLCIVQMVRREGRLGYNPMPKETAWEFIQLIATYQHVNVEDERSYDSDDFPKPIWPWMDDVEHEHCGLCREPLVEQESPAGRWLP